MPAEQLPQRPDLDQLRRQAKELRDAARAGDPTALERVNRHLRPPADPLALSAAQHAIAREHGFSSWPRLKAAVEGGAASLHDAVEANDVALVRLLLERGADANDGHALAHAAEHADHRCLRLLLDHGATVRGAGALVALIGRGDVEGARLLLDAGADPGRPQPAGSAPIGLMPDLAENPLAAAARRDSAAVVELLLEAGADPDAPSRDGRSPLRAAVRRGAGDVAAVLRRFGARDDADDADRFLGACARADRAEAERLAAAGRLELSPDDHAVIVDAAENGDAAAVRLMLDLGFPADARRGMDGASSLHAAAYMGRVEMVRLLIEAGADVERRDGQWQSTPICWAAVGSGEHPRPDWPADWVATVQALIAAGASTRDAIVEGKPPSREVAALLRAPAEPPAARAEPPAVDPALLDRMAGQLRHAFESGDVDLLASLLHPDVRWGGGGPRGCWNRTQVLDWYRVLGDRFGPVRVARTAVHEDAVQLFVPVPGRPDWSQTFRVAGESIVEISG